MGLFVKKNQTFFHNKCNYSAKRPVIQLDSFFNYVFVIKGNNPWNPQANHREGFSFLYTFLSIRSFTNTLRNFASRRNFASKPTFENKKIFINNKTLTNLY